MKHQHKAMQQGIIHAPNASISNIQPMLQTYTIMSIYLRRIHIRISLNCIHIFSSNPRALALNGHRIRGKKWLSWLCARKAGPHSHAHRGLKQPWTSAQSPSSPLISINRISASSAELHSLEARQGTSSYNVLRTFLVGPWSGVL